ncbi:MAG: deoxyribonuclease IV [Candidatus Liptonbacteria bacterium]|nr:deoxyribonuclease IV [Candidatus Liptonbacteria bacterium]
MSMPLIGAHVSTAGGLYNAIINAERIGAEAIQIFGSSPRQWHAKLPDEDMVKKFRVSRDKSNVKKVYLHGTYLVNLGTANAEMLLKSENNLQISLKISDALHADGVIFHVGSGKNDHPKEEAMKIAISAIKRILTKTPGTSRLIIENAAGGGEKLGYDAKEIGAMLRAIHSDRVKVCYDTAHAFEAGAIERYDDRTIRTFFDEWDKEVGLENIVALHVNDSKSAFNSRHDRHENIGEGHIGLEGFKNLAREKRLHHAAWILEVPGFDDMGPDKKNVDLLKSCFE